VGGDENSVFDTECESPYSHMELTVKKQGCEAIVWGGGVGMESQFSWEVFASSNSF
jgi:hypothetical protein